MEAAAQAPQTLKMQASWPSTVTAWDNFRFLAERLDKTTAGAIKIETMTAGQVVPAYESTSTGELIINADIWKSFSPQHQEKHGIGIELMPQIGLGYLGLAEGLDERGKSTAYLRVGRSF